MEIEYTTIVTISDKLVVSFKANTGFITANRAVREMETNCTFTNPRYIAAIKGGRSGWGIPRKVKLFTTRRLSGSTIMAFTTDRGYLYKALRILDNYQIKYKIIDKRISSAATSHFVTLESLHVDGQPVVWRPEQEKLLGDVLGRIHAAAHMPHGQIYEQGIIEAPTGSGKTLMAMELIRTLKQRTIVLVHTRALLNQWKREIIKCMHVEPGVVVGGVWPTKLLQDDIIIVMSQTAVRNMEAWKRVASFYGMLILEECHHAPANTWRKLAWNAPCKYRIGISASPFREDGMTPIINNVCGGKLAKMTLDETRKSGGTVPIKVYPCSYNGYIPIVDNWAAFVTALVEDDNRTAAIVKLAQNAAQQAHVLILSDRVDHVERIAAKLREQGITPVVLHGRMKKDVREEQMERLRQISNNGSDSVTVGTTGLLGEGINIPCWNACILATPMSSRNKLLQVVGRISRQFEGKNVGFVADIIDNHPLAASSWTKRARTYRKYKMQIEKTRRI